jgi:hypothetical protein
MAHSTETHLAKRSDVKYTKPEFVSQGMVYYRQTPLDTSLDWPILYVGLRVENCMHWIIRNIVVILVASFAVSFARAASLRETIPQRHPVQKAEFDTNLGPSNDATKRTYTQGRCMRLIKKHLPSNTVLFREQSVCISDSYIIVYRLYHTSFETSLYYSSLRNKAPPSA